MLVQIQLVRLLVGSLVRLLVGKSYHTKQKDGYSLPTNGPTNNRTNWIWTSKKTGLYITSVLMLDWINNKGIKLYNYWANHDEMWWNRQEFERKSVEKKYIIWSFATAYSENRQKQMICKLECVFLVFYYKLNLSIGNSLYSELN